MPQKRKRHPSIDLLEPHCLTALPGSEDHHKLFKAGAYLDADLNKYDLEHVTTAHPKMSREGWEKLYRDSWLECFRWSTSKPCCDEA